jgi:hypothetical protein
MKLTKEEALKRLKNALDRKKAWEEKFDAKYADVKCTTEPTPLCTELF